MRRSGHHEPGTPVIRSSGSLVVAVLSKTLPRPSPTRKRCWPSSNCFETGRSIRWVPAGMKIVPPWGGSASKAACRPPAATMLMAPARIPREGAGSALRAEVASTVVAAIPAAWPAFRRKARRGEGPEAGRGNESLMERVARDGRRRFVGALQPAYDGKELRRRGDRSEIGAYRDAKTPQL